MCSAAPPPDSEVWKQVPGWDQCAGLRLAEPQRQAAVGMEFDAEEFAEPLAAIPLLTKFFADLGLAGSLCCVPVSRVGSVFVRHAVVVHMHCPRRWWYFFWDWTINVSSTLGGFA